MAGTIFGDETAAMDDLLWDCYVEPKEVSRKPILVGRWGIGKSALFFYANKKLFQELAKNDKEDRFRWYIGEDALDPSLLADLRARFDSERLKRIFERIWRAEIIRAISILLLKLHQHYGSLGGKHWDFITRIAKAENALLPIWRQVPNFIAICLGGDKGRENALNRVESSLANLFYDKAFDYLQACLHDIRNYQPQPVVVIDPIDTPTSGLEKGGMAQPVITALLNLYCRAFMPSEHQLAQLRISIPWHRYVTRGLDFPQRFHQSVGRIKWNEQSLRDFINRRIEWEFRRIHRSFTRKGSVDAWSTLFQDHVLNDHCIPKIREDSFRYILRHTHHRPRDIQRLARRAVIKHAFLSGYTEDQILLGRAGQKITESTIRETVREVCPQITQDEFLIEVERKYSDANELINLVYGLKVPFRVRDLKKRYRAIANSEISPLRLKEIIDKLWTSGIIGVEIIPKSEKEVHSLRTILAVEAFRQYNVGRKKIYRWYFFAYNWDGKPLELIKRYETSEETDATLVLHPATFQHLLPDVSRECPIGV